MLLFTDPNTTDPWDDAQMIETIRHCDKQNVPIATNLASAEMFILGLQRGDLDWREMVHSKQQKLLNPCPLQVRVGGDAHIAPRPCGRDRPLFHGKSQSLPPRGRWLGEAETDEGTRAHPQNQAWSLSAGAPSSVPGYARSTFPVGEGFSMPFQWRAL